MAAMLAWGLLATLAALPTLAADDFLPPEQAFQVTGRMVSAERAEVTLQITSGYYVYREPDRKSVV